MIVQSFEHGGSIHLPFRARSSLVNKGRRLGRAIDGEENNRTEVHKFNIFFYRNQCLLYQQSTLNCKHQRKQEGRRKGEFNQVI